MTDGIFTKVNYLIYLVDNRYHFQDGTDASRHHLIYLPLLKREGNLCVSYPRKFDNIIHIN